MKSEAYSHKGATGLLLVYLAPLYQEAAREKNLIGRS